MIPKLILDTLSGPSGKSSTMRIATLGICGTVMSVWGYISVMKLEMQPVNDELVFLVLGSLGAKVLQRKEETKQEPAKEK